MILYRLDELSETNSISFAITDTYGACVETISLSHVDRDAGTAGIGYWITSSRWGEGIGSEAFDLVLSFARQAGLREVSARIEVGNVASRRIWARPVRVIPEVSWWQSVKAALQPRLQYL